MYVCINIGIYFDLYKYIHEYIYIYTYVIDELESLSRSFSSRVEFLFKSNSGFHLFFFGKTTDLIT